MKTALDTYQPPSSLLQTLPLARTNQFVKEQYRAQSEGVNISLTTQEGDVISLSQNTSTEQMKAKYKNDDGLTKIESSMASSNLSFSVQGDLNDQELADLTKLLNNLSGIADNFFKGNMNQAVTGALNIGDMGSINKLEATFTRSSILSTHMDVPHPIPSFAGQENDPLRHELHNNHATLQEPSMVETMAAQWRQFLNSLTEQDGIPSQPANSPTANSASQVAKEMLARAKETMITHPRLTPLVPSVANLAIDQAAQPYGQQSRHNARRITEDISTSFTKELNNWFL